MPRLFISYSRNDEAFARRLATSLSEMGGDIWIDIKDIPVGMKWSSAIQQGLDICDAMIVILTPASASSQNVEDEWQYYRDRGKPIVPVLVAPAQLHYQLSRLQYINFYSQSYDIGLTQLHAELWRSGIALRQPANAVTMPVPRAPQQAYATPSGVTGPRPQPARKSSGRGIFTLGCVGVLIVGVLVLGGFLAFGGMDLLNGSVSGTPTRPPDTATPGAEVTHTAPVIIIPQVLVASESARLRTGPGVSFPTLDTFALSGERFDVVAQARSAEDTEDWFLIDHPTVGRVWISAVTVDLQPDGVFVPPPATVPPTLTYTPSPTESPTALATATDAARVINFSGLIAFSGQIYSAMFNTDRYTVVEVRAQSDFSSSLQVTLRNSSGVEIAANANTLVTTLLAFQNYEIIVSDPAGGTGSVDVVIELRSS